jgi:hypothetical protein
VRRFGTSRDPVCGCLARGIAGFAPPVASHGRDVARRDAIAGPRGLRRAGRGPRLALRDVGDWVVGEGDDRAGWPVNGLRGRSPLDGQRRPASQMLEDAPHASAPGTSGIGADRPRTLRINRAQVALARAAGSSRARLSVACTLPARSSPVLFRRKVGPKCSGTAKMPRFQTLPSTSPANAAIPYSEKVSRWSVVRRECET